MTATDRPTPEQIWQWLGEVPDPEIPMVSVVELGIVRDVAWMASEGGAHYQVTITPTYSGCPATDVIAAAVEQTLRDHGLQQVAVKSRLSPAWTTDWISEAGRRKLRASGIAPPVQKAAAIGVIDLSSLKRRSPPAVLCPHCGSENTRVTSQFGSTACKALYRCNDCLEPFDHFKSH